MKVLIVLAVIGVAVFFLWKKFGKPSGGSGTGGAGPGSTGTNTQA